MGKPGGGKSHLAASLADWEHPIQVFCFDSLGKDLPYEERGQLVQDPGHSSAYVLDSKGNPIIRLNYFHEAEPEMPSAFEAFRAFMIGRGHLEPIGEFPPAAWVLDSCSMFELALRGYSRYRLNPNTKEPRQHWGFATDQLEQTLLQRFAPLPGLVLVLCHIDSDKDERDGSYIYNPKLPGRLRDNCGMGYTEIWRLYNERDKKGVKHLVQTQPCERYGCMSNSKVPDGRTNTFSEMFA